ncbi:MAG: serine protease [Candidatus Cloacimonetes bacterium]|nr:serine protease [Candidatus Cloacimonadota bacterium]
MIKFKIIMTVMLILLGITLLSEDEIPQDKIHERIPYFNLEERVETIIKNSVSIETIQNSKLDTAEIIGSGFMIENNSKRYAVTCYHVVEKIGQQNIIVGFNAKKGKGYCLCTNKIENKEYDIAILELDSQFRLVENKKDTTLVKATSFTFNMIENNDRIIEGLGTIIIGYSLGLGCEYIKNEPIVRTGIVAQRVNEETGTFLIDGIVNPYNSGSPVYNSKNGKLIGIVQAYKPDKIKEKVNEKYNHTNFVFNSGLTKCMSAEKIKELIPSD